MHKQQTLTIAVPVYDEDPAETVADAFRTLGYRVSGPGEDVGRNGVVVIEED